MCAGNGGEEGTHTGADRREGLELVVNPDWVGITDPTWAVRERPGHSTSSGEERDPRQRGPLGGTLRDISKAEVTEFDHCACCVIC